MRKTYLSNRHLMLLMSAYLIALYIPMATSRLMQGDNYLPGDCFYYRIAVVSIIEDGDLILDNNVSNYLNGQLAVGRGGFVPKHPILMSLVSLPFYVLFGDLGLLLFNLINCGILALLIFKLNLFFHNRGIAFALSIIYATTTLFYDYAYNYSPDIFSTVLFVGGVYLVVRQRFYRGAAILGLSIFAKLPNLPLVALVGLYVLFQLWKQSAGRPKTHLITRLCIAGAIFLLALAPMAFTNYYLFGSPWTTGYEMTALPGPTPGEVTISQHTAKFNQPLVTGLMNVLFDPLFGVIPTNLVVLVALVGLRYLKRNSKRIELYLLAAICLTQLVFFAKYDEWSTSHFSNRFMMIAIALSSVFVGQLIAHIGERFVLVNPPQQEA